MADDDAFAALELCGIVKQFGGMRALDHASLRVRRGTVHALLGENGAGKTTLMRIAFGMTRADSGTMDLDGRSFAPQSPKDAIAAGVGMVHQHFTLVPAMTVGENLALGGHGLLERNPGAELTEPIAQVMGGRIDPRARVETLSVSEQQRVETAKALVRGARLLILDEPTAVLAPVETDALLKWLRDYVAAGNAVVIITHKLREALAVADDVTVLRHGAVAWSGAADATNAELLARAMIGEGGSDAAAEPSSPTGHSSREVFRVAGLSARDDSGTVRLRDASFVVRAGEVVGIVGVEGSGQRELLRILAGRMAAAGGCVTRPDDVGFVPEDRHEDAVLLDRTLVENVALRGAGARRGRMSWPSQRALTARLMRTFDVRASSESAVMRALSGGNQQKLVLARELGELKARDRTHTEGLVLENPTRGLDVRAMAEVHEQLRAACRRGAAIVFYSSDIDEVLAIASRVLVAHAGVIAEVPTDRDAVGRAMVGAA